MLLLANMWSAGSAYVTVHEFQLMNGWFNHLPIPKRRASFYFPPVTLLHFFLIFLLVHLRLFLSLF